MQIKNMEPVLQRLGLTVMIKFDFWYSEFGSKCIHNKITFLGTNLAGRNEIKFRILISRKLMKRRGAHQSHLQKFFSV